MYVYHRCNLIDKDISVRSIAALKLSTSSEKNRSNRFLRFIRKSQKRDHAGFSKILCVTIIFAWGDSQIRSFLFLSFPFFFHSPCFLLFLLYFFQRNRRNEKKMQRVLSFQMARGFSESSEFVTKRMCFSFLFSVGFLCLLCGFLLGRFASERSIEFRAERKRLEFAGNGLEHTEHLRQFLLEKLAETTTYETYSFYIYISYKKIDCI